jgi:hypothetical protein
LFFFNPSFTIEEKTFKKRSGSEQKMLDKNNSQDNDETGAGVISAGEKRMGGVTKEEQEVKVNNHTEETGEIKKLYLITEAICTQRSVTT